MNKFRIHTAIGQYEFLEQEGDNLDEMLKIHNRYTEKGVPLTPNKVETVIQRSFNEGIDIRRDNSSCFYNGVHLLSGTSWLKKYIKPFDRMMIAPKVAKSWGVEEHDVLNLWEDMGKLTSTFGSVIHRALELYFKHQNTADRAFTKKGERVNISKHPILKSVIEEFEKIRDIKGEVFCEELITDVKNNRCGVVDLLTVTGNKECYIEDYKIQIEEDKVDSKEKLLAPYDNLIANKLSHYALQLSFYAEIMEKTGWTVKGLNVYVYNNGWKKYTLDRVEIK